MPAKLRQNLGGQEYTHLRSCFAMMQYSSAGLCGQVEKNWYIDCCMRNCNMVSQGDWSLKDCVHIKDTITLPHCSLNKVSYCPNFRDESELDDIVTKTERAATTAVQPTSCSIYRRDTYKVSLQSQQTYGSVYACLEVRLARVTKCMLVYCPGDRLRPTDKVQFMQHHLGYCRRSRFPTEGAHAFLTL